MPPQPTQHHADAHECSRSPFAIAKRPEKRSQPRSDASAAALSRHGLTDAFCDGGCSEVRLPSRDTGSPASAAVRSLTVSGSPRAPHPNREPHVIANRRDAALGTQPNKQDIQEAACGIEGHSDNGYRQARMPGGRMLPNFAWQHAYLQRSGVATRPSRTSRSNTPNLLSRVQHLKRKVEKSAELGQASMTARNTRHPLGSNTPVREQHTR